MKTPLKAANKPKVRKKRGAPKSIRELIKVADKEFSRYVRLRDCLVEDGAFVGLCITCEKKIVIRTADEHWNKGANLGHFVGRATYGLRFDEENCNMQCAWCNAWRDKESMITAYRKALDMKYGTGTASKLVRAGQEEHKFSKEELLEIIHDSKEACAYMLHF